MRNIIVYGDEDHPFETINLASAPSETKLIDVWRSSHPTVIPNMIMFMYTVTGLAGAGSLTISPRWNADPTPNSLGRAFYNPEALATGGPDTDESAWLSAATVIKLRTTSNADIGPVGFRLGQPSMASGNAGSVVYFPYRFMFSFLTNTYSAGTFKWWWEAHFLKEM